MREMRRIRQQMSEENNKAVLERCTHGMMGVMGMDGYPYTVPVSFAYYEDAIYFHCAKEGHKIDAIRACDKVSFTVVDSDEIKEKEYTTYFRSVMVFGRASVVEDEQEKRDALLAIACKYSPSMGEDSHNAVIARSGPRAHVVKIVPERITGKEAIEYVQAKEAGEM